MVKDLTLTPNIYRGDEKLEFESEVSVLISAVDSALTSSDENKISSVVFPLCTRFVLKYVEEVTGGGEMPPPQMLKEMVNIMVLGYVFSDWIVSEDLLVKMDEEEKTKEDLIKAVTNVVTVVQEQIDSLVEATLSQLSTYLNIERGSLGSDSIDYKIATLTELPNVVERILASQE